MDKAQAEAIAAEKLPDHLFGYNDHKREARESVAAALRQAEADGWKRGMEKNKDVLNEIAEYLQDAYDWITQPKRMAYTEIVYDSLKYDALTEYIREGLKKVAICQALAAEQGPAKGEE